MENSSSNQNLPFRSQNASSNVPFHVVPDNVAGGWNVYAAHKPHEPQRHFESREEAIAFAEKLATMEGTGFSVEEYESRSIGR